jgi:hypothetical protein
VGVSVIKFCFGGQNGGLFHSRNKEKNPEVSQEGFDPSPHAF